MRFGLKHFVTPCAIVVAVLTVVGCGGGSETVQEDMDAQRQAELEALENAKEALDAQREELSALRAQVKDPSTIPAPEEGEAPTVEELQIQVEKLEVDIQSAVDDLSKSVVEFINLDPPVAGGELSETQRRATSIKISEDILVAQEWIDKGGDYRRALTIMEGLIPLDPQNQELRDAIAHAKEMRFVTEERFGEVKSGQTEEEVREVLGPVNLRNIKEYPEKNVVAWFYPKEDGGAAGVYFRKRGGTYKVYETNFTAVEQKVLDGSEGG
jgi:hypothetical protein